MQGETENRDLRRPKGPLVGVRIVELAGIGPGPMCAMLLADLGATVLRIDRTEPVDLGVKRPMRFNLLLRNRKSIALDLKKSDAVELVLRLVELGDALIEGFRPGVMERLGLGPDACLARNPRLVYGRMTGWGQYGPLASSAGHDLGYIAVTGVLNAIGRRDQLPAIPLNLIGDFGGGALYLAMGILAAIIESRSSGKGQVVDAAIVDGTASLATTFFGMAAAGMLKPDRGTNLLDSGAHFYEVYQCGDGKLVSVAAVEQRFHDELLRRLGIDPASIGQHLDPANWPKAREILAEKFKTRTRDEWCALLEGTDACFAPVLSWDEAIDHPHLKARNTLVEVEGVVQPAAAPRFSRTPTGLPTPPEAPSASDVDEALSEWFDGPTIQALRTAGTVG